MGQEHGIIWLHWQHEPIPLVGTVIVGKLLFGGLVYPLKRLKRLQSGRYSSGDTRKYVHPTQKPLELLAIPIKNSSLPGNTVVDLCGGSGSTLMTCDQMNRSCRPMEIDPKFCDVIKRQYQESISISLYLFII